MDPNRRPPATSGSGSSGDSSPASPSSSGAPAGDKAATPGGNVFANDGSFMEMFKKKMEAEERRKKEQQEQRAGGGGDARASEHGQTPVDKKPPPVTSFVGKRRGGVFLKTGMVAKKQKDESEVVPGKSDAWSSYMAEVKKYKAHQCGDDDKTRPLVK
ncbi:telomerase RNA component interacting RNase [Hippoglossus hippoglossus]|uniref:telomerase RNA component interacting RNase n=1 Tax=Hippoglossus hippoglossus TaxID=8267 RepID=UPI00148D700E|nr:telomerase RNA component interacting RNase [Hippoglossus hippoglossus]XP_035037364.1 telomerase RNA component interacting RNase [Hippoglossus stenolepis]XP_035037365.1 telomerase RNA component interacting RNase [Hippoglossus stenolepis]XP_035037366.1 telomerase RNA component interacting RNase [Hippoglossus stenolepis]